jgi:hypothetical protein
MSLPANTRRDRYVANQGQTVFPYTFRIFAAADLVVERLRNNTTTTLQLNTDYTVSGVGNNTGGNVTLTQGALANDIIAIVSNQPNQRSTDFTESGDFRAAALNAEFDRIWIGLQQLQQRLSRQLTAPLSDALGMSYLLPPQAQRANKLLGFDTSGQPMLATGQTINNVLITLLGEQIISAATDVAARTVIGATSAADVAAAVAALQALTVLRDGSQAMTGALAMGGQKITGLGAATADTDAAQFGQIGAWLRDNRVLIQEQRADGTNAGTSTAGSWQARGITLVEVLDSGNLASVSGSTFTLAPGTWDVSVRMPFSNSTGGARGRLWNVTDSAAVAGSLTETASFGGTTTYNSNMYAVSKCRIVLSATAEFRVEYFVQVGAANIGLGTHDGITAGPEIFTTIDAMRLAP